MTYLVSKDWSLEARAGNITGVSRVVIRGHDDTVPNGGPFSLAPGFGGSSYTLDQSGIDATPATVGVASTDNTNDNSGGTGALTVRVSGLDSSGNAATEDVTMTGTTAATTVATWSAITGLQVLTTGSNNANTGTIYVGTGTFTAGVPATKLFAMGVGDNIGLTAYYVVPTGKELFLTHFIMTLASSNKDAELIVKTSSDGAQWYHQGHFGLESGNLITTVSGLPAFAAGTHVTIDAVGSAASTDISAFLSAELRDV